MLFTHPQNSPLTALSILVVEDDRIMSLLMRDVLTSLGFSKIFMAEDGSSAIEFLKNNEVDLAICDWKMYPMSGIEFVQFVRRSPESPDKFMPVIMVTGHGDYEEVMLARDAGINEYVVKPISASTLFAKIKAVIETPRSFIVSRSFRGPDRRRRSITPPTGIERRRKRRKRLLMAG